MKSSKLAGWGGKQLYAMTSHEIISCEITLYAITLYGITLYAMTSYEIASHGIIFHEKITAGLSVLPAGLDDG